LGVVVRVKPSDPGLPTAAAKLRLPVFQPERVNDPEFVAQVTALHPDLNVAVSYDQILRRAIIETAGLGFVNFHAGKLPRYRGRSVINWAIINGEAEIGMTAHYIDEGIDTGDIILQRTVPVDWTDTYGDILGKAVMAFPGLVSDTIRLIVTGEAARRPQACQEGTYFPARGAGDEWLDLSDRSIDLHNKIRAITRPGPGARTLLGQRTVTIWRAYYDPSWPKYMAIPGQVVGRRPMEGVLVKTGDSTLLVQEVQVEGAEAEVPTWAIGTRLGVNLPSMLMELLVRVKSLEGEIHRLERGKS
jgi:methionyl-tRNA formyltransferase